MDRRNFLKIAGIGGAALGLGACGASSRRNADASKAVGMVDKREGISLLGFGCMRWPMKDGIVDQETVNALVDKAMEHGVNYFDTSPVYMNGKSEEAAAAALKRHPRDSYFIATKLSSFREKCNYQDQVAMYRRSLEIFETDHIDYYLLHNLNDAASFKTRFEDTGIMDFLLKEREKGAIRHLGYSFHGTTKGFDEVMEVCDKYKFEFVQIQMNYKDWKHTKGRNEDAEYKYNEIVRRGLKVVVMEPLLGGRLAKLPATLSDMLKAREPDLSAASWSFRFCASFPGVMTVLSGMNKMEHLEDNLRTFNKVQALSENDFKLLDDIADRLERFPMISCTGCDYCMPCPYGIDIPAIFKFYNDSVRDGSYVTSKEQKAYERKRRRYLLGYNRAIPSLAQADRCISCGKCVKACPQKIPIPRELKRIDEYIEKIKTNSSVPLR